MADGAIEQQQARGPWADGELRFTAREVRAAVIPEGIRDALACAGVSDYPLSNGALRAR